MKKSLGPDTLIYPTPTWVVGTYDKAGKPNLMTIAWGGICCSKPPCVAISLRAATYTHGCVMAAKAFTVNIPSQRIAIMKSMIRFSRRICSIVSSIACSRSTSPPGFRPASGRPSRLGAWWRRAR